MQKEEEKEVSSEESSDEELDFIEEVAILEDFTAITAKAFCKLNCINVYGSDAPNPIRTFDELFRLHSIHPFLVKNIQKMKFPKPTPVQMQSFPAMLQVNKRRI